MVDTPRPNKINEKRLQEIVNESLASGRLILAPHAEDRMSERGISFEEIKQILLRWNRKKARDRFDDIRGLWKYGFEGTDVDDCLLRVIIAIDVQPDGTRVVVVTAYFVGDDEGPNW